MKRASRLHLLKTHGVLFTAGFIALLAAGAATNEALNASLVHGNVSAVDIAVEHKESTHLTMNTSTRGDRGLVELSHDSSETILVSLPSEWLRREVRHASLSDIQPEPPTFGFTRWKLPGGARVTFEAQQALQGVILHNPSKVPLRVSFTHVDLETEETLHDSRFVQDNAMQLW